MNETNARTAPNGSSRQSAPGDTPHAELHEAKAHLKEAARATLLAMRNAIDFALNKLGDDTAGPKPDGPDAASPSTGPHEANDG
jgi:hypothetical protein